MPEREEIVEEGMEQELETLDIVLTTKISRTVLSIEEYIKVRELQGATLATIRAGLLADLDTGGRIFGEFRNAIRPTFAGSVSRFRDVGMLAETGILQTYRWVAVLVNTCPDCIGRHNQTKTWKEWEIAGLPRTGATVCRENCKCVLLPKEVTELEPIYRSKN